MTALPLLTFLLAPGCGLTEVPEPPVDDTGEVTAMGDLTLSSTELDFGYVEPGMSGQKALTFGNTGEEAIALLNLVVDSLSFDVLEDDAVPGNLLPGEELVLTVVFTPDSEDDFSAELTLSTDALDAELVDVALIGTGIEGGGGDTGGGGGGTEISLSSTSHDFGEVDIGRTESATITLSNVGDDAVLLTQVTSSDAAFGWGAELALPYVLAKGASRDFTVTYSPTEERVNNGVVTVQTDAEVNPEVPITLTGSGFHGCTVCSPLIDLDSGEADPATLGWTLFTAIGTTETKSAIITNVGDQALEVTGASVSFDNSFFPACSFSTSGISGTRTLAPWASMEVSVTFSGPSTCYIEGSLDVQSNDPYEPTSSLRLTGTAI